LNVSYEKNYFCPDEKVNVICELDNTRCQLNATCIKLRLYQVISLKDKKQRVKIIRRNVAESQYQGTYLAGQENTRTLELILNDNFNPTLQHLDKCLHKHLFQDIKMISKLQATVQSPLIDCRYFFEVGTDWDSCICCSGRPTIDIPIIMYIPDLRINTQMYQPNNWNPQVMPQCEVVFSQNVVTTVTVPTISVNIPTILPNISMNVGNVGMNVGTVGMQVNPNIGMQVNPNIVVRPQINENISMNVGMGGMGMSITENVSVRNNNNMNQGNVQMNMNVGNNSGMGGGNINMSVGNSGMGGGNINMNMNNF